MKKSNGLNKWVLVGTSSITEKFIISLKIASQQIVCVIATSDEKAHAFAQKWKIPNFSSDYKVVNADYDNVYIASPNIFHYEQAKHFLSINKNVLVEKPMTHDPVLTKELFELADKNKVKVMEAYAHIYPDRLKQYRMNGKVLKCNLMQVSSKIKEGIAKTASSFNKARFGGAIADLGPYPLALAIWLNGPVSKLRIIDFKIWNDVEVDVTYELIHNNGAITRSRVSKIEDGDNAVYIDDSLVAKSTSMADVSDRMNFELKEFLSGNYSFTRSISNEVAKLIDMIKTSLKTK